MSEQKPTWTEAFISLTWYESLLQFIANFVAKSSEILLTAGLVVSSANFLSDGSMLRDGTPMAIAWAWTQAIAVDGSLGISFYEVFQSAKRRDWIKLFLYMILTILLTLVAWFVTEGDILSHAANTSSHEAIQIIGIDVRILSTLRAIAAVGFVLMSRVRHVTLWESSQRDRPTHIEADEVPEEKQSAQNDENLEKIIQSVLQKHFYSVTITPEEHQESITTSQGVQQQAIPEKTGQQNKDRVAHNLTGPLQSKTAKRDREEKEHISYQISQNHKQLLKERQQEQDERLLQAYQELQREGQPITGRALAQRAHVRRATCLEWLRVYQLSQPSI